MKDNKHSNASHQIEQYGLGFQDGASGRHYPKRLGNDPDYLRGYADGEMAFKAAMQQERERLGSPLRSVAMQGDTEEAWSNMIDAINDTFGQIGVKGFKFVDENDPPEPKFKLRRDDDQDNSR